MVDTEADNQGGHLPLLEADISSGGPWRQVAAGQGGICATAVVHPSYGGAAAVLEPAWPAGVRSQAFSILHSRPLYQETDTHVRQSRYLQYHSPF
jgi:hypothetical protein